MSEDFAAHAAGRGRHESLSWPTTASSIRTSTCGSTIPQFPFAEGAHVPERDAAPETLLDLMKANGVTKTVIIQVIHYRYDNRYLADVLKRYPSTFQGVCRVDPLDPAAPDHLSQLTEQGFRGVRLSPAGNASGDWFHGPLMPPLWKRCARSEGADDGAGADRAHAGGWRCCWRSCRT